MTVISFITPQPYHKIYQNRLIYDELKKRGWEVQYNDVNDKTTILFCTCASQFGRTDELSKEFKLPYMTWIPDIGPGGGWENDNIFNYIEHIKTAWRAMAICNKTQWKAMEVTGRYRIDLVRPCIDNHSINSCISSPPSKLNQVVVVGAMAAHKRNNIIFRAWEELPEPRPDLVFITYGVLDHPLDIKGYDQRTMGIRGIYAQQIMYEAAKYKNKVKFIVADDEAKYKIIAESKLLVCADDFGGFNLPPIEAYFCGTPTLVSDDHCFSDIKSNSFRTNDVFDLSSKILMALKYDDNDEDDEYNFKEYTIEECCNRLEAKFKEWGMEK